MSFQNCDNEYEDANPLVVEDTEISKRSTIDREDLAKIIDLLANKIFHALQQDKETNKRYATRMILSNRVACLVNGPNGVKRKKTREIFVVKLPYSVTSWNDMDIEDLTLQLAKTVVDIHDHYKWHKVQVQVTHFISHEAKETLEKMEAEENTEFLLPETSISNPVPKATSREESMSEREPVGPAITQRNIDKQTPKDLNPKPCDNNNDEDDDDDDIEIICEIAKN